MKLFASDFDGTIRRYDRRVPYILEEDKKAIEAFRNNGNLFGMCSGRAFDSILKEAHEMPYADFYIVSTGAVIGRVKKGRMELSYEQCVSREYARDLYERFGKDQKVFYVHLDGYLYRIGRSEGGETAQNFIASFDQLPDGHIQGVSIGTDSNDTAFRITNAINQLYPDVSAFQNNDYLDTVKRGCSKGGGIIRLRGMYEADLIGGIGDSFNDIPLLDEADVSFTFGFSDERVKAHADYIVKSVAEALDIFSKL